MTQFAVIKTGGKQYKVQEGQVLSVEKLDTTESNINFDQVLLVADEDKVQVGQPVVSGAQVSATILEHGKAEKKIVFRYKSKTRQRKKKGHRQPYTMVRITKITA